MFECWQDLLCQGTPVGCQASQPVPPSVPKIKAIESQVPTLPEILDPRPHM